VRQLGDGTWQAEFDGDLTPAEEWAVRNRLLSSTDAEEATAHPPGEASTCPRSTRPWPLSWPTSSSSPTAKATRRLTWPDSQDLVLQAQPSLVDKCIASATEGRSWRWEITGFVDTLGADIDLTSATCDLRHPGQGRRRDRADADRDRLERQGHHHRAPRPQTAGPGERQAERDCVWSLV
jgi:hypothetical protein